MNLRDYLQEHGLSQFEAARKLDVPRRTFQYWVRHERPPYMVRMIIECLERRLTGHELSRKL